MRWCASVTRNHEICWFKSIFVFSFCQSKNDRARRQFLLEKWTEYEKRKKEQVGHNLVLASIHDLFDERQKVSIKSLLKLWTERLWRAEAAGFMVWRLHLKFSDVSASSSLVNCLWPLQKCFSCGKRATNCFSGCDYINNSKCTSTNTYSLCFGFTTSFGQVLSS